MATFSATGQGTTVTLRRKPSAIIAANPEVGVLGSVVRLDGNASVDPDDRGLLFNWSFVSVPIGSMVMQEGFRVLDEGGGLVSFSPDAAGEYLIGLEVANDAYTSYVTQRISIRPILVPDGRGLVPDGKFIWSYIRDVWQQVENKEVFETLWSALIQICGSELLKLYQVDFNKSIRDIQDYAQRRWLKYEPKLELATDDLSFYLGNELAGSTASTEILGQSGKAIIISPNDVIVTQGSVLADVVGPFSILYSRGPENVGDYPLVGINAARTGYKLASTIPEPYEDRILQDAKVEFAFRSKVWSVGVAPPKRYAEKMAMFPSPIDYLTSLFQFGRGNAVMVSRGDVILVKSGVNQGLYHVTKVTGAFIEVAEAPPSRSGDNELVDVYRPVGFKLPAIPKAVTNTFSLPYDDTTAGVADLAPGRIITVGRQAFTILRTYYDPNQEVPLIIVNTDQGEVITSRTSLNWRVPNTLISKSQDFEELGVTTGDVLLLDLLDASSNAMAEVRAQVVGVTGRRLGFVATIEPLTAGSGYKVPDSVFVSVCGDLHIDSAQIARNGEFLRSDKAAELYTFLHSLEFRNSYWNKELTPSSAFVTPAGSYYLKPKAIIRNSHIPVDPSIRSIPALQEWIVQPDLVQNENGLFQRRGEKYFPLARKPVVLLGNNDYVIDSEVALEDTFAFRTGSEVMEIEGASFLDRRIGTGDTVTVLTPLSIARDYLVSEVLDQDRIVVTPPVEEVPGDGMVSARLRITRRRNGTFLRIIPGGFSAKNPLPDRLWAEVTYFDNSDVVESNFGILVGVRKGDLKTLEAKVSYRQAVAGLMFAYTRGSTIEKVRLGAQILLGLPFSEHRGIVRDINPDYRLDVHGDPRLGRILVEDIDDSGNALGVQRVYTYPVDPASALAGIETNPVTGKNYAVGDTVELFAPLAKGVAIDDYLNDPLALDSDVRLQLQQFHSFRMRANDNIFELDELSVVSDFLRRITPSYVSFVIRDVTEVQNQVTIDDSFSMLLALSPSGVAMADNPSTGLTTSFNFDQHDYNGRIFNFWDIGVTQPRLLGKKATTLDPNIIRVGANLLQLPGQDGVVTRQGDLVVLFDGPYDGIYTVDTVTDAQVTVSDGPPGGFSQADHGFMVLRPFKGELRRGVISQVTAAPDPGEPRPADWAATSLVAIEEGVVADGVMPGDHFVTELGEIATITELLASGATWNGVRVLPPITSPVSTPYRIYRTRFLVSPSEDTATLVSNGSIYTSFSNTYLKALAVAGDMLVVDGTGMPELYIANPSLLDIRPVLPAGSYTVRLCKPGHSTTAIDFNTIERCVPEDVLTLTPRLT